MKSTLRGDSSGSKRTVYKAIHRTKFAYSYLTIVPIINPFLPGYVSYDSYKIVRLSGGSSVFTVIIRSMFNSLYKFVESSTNFESEGVIDILVVILIALAIAATYMFSCFLIACCVYGYKLQRYEMIRPSAPSEHEMRGGARHRQENSLDMLDHTART